MLAAATAAFITVFIAEFGDKTQLVSLSMASRYPPLQVLGGAMTALALVVGLGVGVGSIIANSVPTVLVTMISGIVFIAIGLLNLFRRDKDKQECTGRTGFFQTMFMIFVAEFGDKTQLAAIFLVASLGQPIAVFVGAMAGMLLNHAIAIYLGSRFLSKLNPRLLKISTSALFILIGFIIIFLDTNHFLN